MGSAASAPRARLVGLTRMPLRQFAAAIFIGGAPRHAAYASLGGAMAAGLTSPVFLAAAGLLGALTIAGALVSWRRRAALGAAVGA